MFCCRSVRGGCRACSWPRMARGWRWGASLGEPEKLDLAEALKAALHRWRNPVFDNPQLENEAV